MVRLLVLDMDGTLIHDDLKISDANHKALSKLMSKGIRICLASGRNVASLMTYAQQLKLKDNNGYLIGGNGQEIYDCHNEELIKKEKIPMSYCHKIVEYALVNKYEFSGNDDNNKRYYYRPDGCLTKNRDFKALNFDTTKKYLDDECDIDKLGIYLPRDTNIQKQVMNLEKITDKQVEIHVVNSSRIEFTGKGINKVVAIRDLCKKLNLCDDDIMVVGDGLNDLKMISTFDNSIAMGNAFDSIKKVAKYVTDECKNDGVAKAVYKYILNKKHS